MEKRKDCMRAQTVFILVATALMSLAVHGYRFVNSMFSHDSLLVIVQEDAAWQVALGRFFEPVLVFLRGDLCSPWLLCLLQVVWFALSVYLLADIFQIQDRLTVVAVAGVVVSSEAFITVNASYLLCADMYSFALFAAIFGVWCIEKKKVLYAVLGIGSMVVSLSTYQAYISVSITLMLLLGLFRLCDFEAELKNIVKRLVYYAVSLLLTAAIYYAAWQIIRRALGIWEADTYNGMASVGQFGAGELLGSVATAYRNVFGYFANPDVMSNIVFRGMELAYLWKYAMVVIHVVLAIIIVSGVFLICRRERNAHKPHAGEFAVRCILLTVCLALFPLACNFVCVMSKGMEHTLMMFGPTLLYVFAAVIARKAWPAADAQAARKEQVCPIRRMTITGGVTVLLGVIVWVHFIYANQIYFKKSQQEKVAYSLLTRIVADVEEIPGYEPGITPVAISGSFENTPYLVELPGFEDIRPYSMGKTSLTYPGTDYAMIHYYLGININLTRVDAKVSAIQQMPVYPEAGSVAVVDGTVVVKISE